MSNPLPWHVPVSTQIPVVTSDLPPGMSTGPRTPEGLERCRRANWKHRKYAHSA